MIIFADLWPTNSFVDILMSTNELVKVNEMKS